MCYSENCFPWKTREVILILFPLVSQKKNKMDETETILDFLKNADIQRFTDKFPHFSESKWTQSIPLPLEIPNELLGEKNYFIL